MKLFHWIRTFLLIFACVPIANSQCPWSDNYTDLHTGCSCGSNANQQITVQCSSVQLNRLILALNQSSESPIALLYVSNSSEHVLLNGTFQGLQLLSLQLSNCHLRLVEAGAFLGQEKSLVSLGLQRNELTEVPSTSIVSLSALSHLDLSQNRIRSIANRSFVGTSLQILKLTDNPVNISSDAFISLEASLRNLNLKGCRLKTVPSALRNLSSLAFLDLAQNNIARLNAGDLEGLLSLTALNLERNPMEKLMPGAFSGVENTLTSLSLLNNGVKQYPQESLAPLSELRVLDLGFNRLQSLPDSAFVNMSALTLLALDGNPLTTIPQKTFAHLNATLRGISVGGRSLVCDCHLKWLSEWIQDYDLQVTSRERSPQFCGQPSVLQNRNFMHIHPDEFVCEKTSSVAAFSTKYATETLFLDDETSSTTVVISSVEDANLHVLNTTQRFEETDFTLSNASISPRYLDVAQQMEVNQTPHVIKLKEVRQRDNVIYITWDAKSLPSFVSDIRVVYRIFGEERYKISSRLSTSDSNFRISKVPANECFIVCIISMQPDWKINESKGIDSSQIPLNGCKEVRSERVEAAEIDKIIIIAASAAICAAVIVAVIIFICCHRHRLQKEQRQMPFQPPITPLPILEPIKMSDWDNVSVYSNRSIPRARMFHNDQSDGIKNSAFSSDEGLTHFNQPPPLKPSNGYLKFQPMLDANHSQRSYSVLGYGTLRKGQFNHYPGNRAELNRSTTSLAHVAQHNTMPGLYKKKTKKGRPTMSSTGSFHSLTGFDPDYQGAFKTDNWNGQNVDVYVQHSMTNPTPYMERDFR